MESQPGNQSVSAPTMAAMAVCLAAMYYVAHRIAQAIVTDYGLLGGYITCGAIYAVSLIMDRRGKISRAPKRIAWPKSLRSEAETMTAAV